MTHDVPKSDKRTLAEELAILQRKYGDVLAVEDDGASWRVTTADAPSLEVRPGTARAEGTAADPS